MPSPKKSENIEFANPLFEATAHFDGEEEDEIGPNLGQRRALFRGKRDYEEVGSASRGRCDGIFVCSAALGILMLGAIVALIVLAIQWGHLFAVNTEPVTSPVHQVPHNQVSIRMQLLDNQSKNTSTIQRDLEPALRHIGQDAEKVGMHLIHTKVAVLTNLTVTCVYQFDTSFPYVGYYVETSFYNETAYLVDRNIGLGIYTVLKESIEFLEENVTISGGICTPADLPACPHIKQTQLATHNSLTHNDVNDVSQKLSRVLRRLSACHPHPEPLLCSLLLPPCDDRDADQREILCREYCIDVVHSCKGYHSVWLNDYNCTALPSKEDGDGMCLMPAVPYSASLNVSVIPDAADQEYVGGRLRVSHGEKEGRVCADDMWSDEDATVICRQLYPSFSFDRAVVTNYTLSNSTDFVIWSLGCKGSELEIDQCPYKILPKSCKDHGGKEAGVQCLKDDQ